jgi:sulfotransferase family protein
MNPFVFIVGCARSGTTLLQRIVHAHPQLAITPEMHWITDYFRAGKWLSPDGRVTAEQVASMMEQKRFRQFDFSREAFAGLLPNGEPQPYVNFLNGLFALYGKIKGKKLVGNKTPAYVRRIAALHAIWPEARFVHLIRDGRDVCLSVLHWDHAYRTAGRYTTWADDPVTTTALWWLRKVQLGRQGGRALSPNLYYEIFYENLVAHPEDECRKLCEFLGLPYDDAMLRFHEGRTRHEPGLDAKKAWLPITPGLRDWRTQMPPQDVERFEAIAGDLLAELGYPRQYSSPSQTHLHQAASVRERFIRDLREREEVLPECW